MSEQSYHTAAPLVTRQHGGAAQGWNRTIDANGIVQYEPAPQPLERRAGAAIVPQAAPYVFDVPTGRQTLIHDKSTELERSTAFVRFTIPLSVAMAAVTLIAALVGGVAALAAVGAAFLAFAACWIGALIYYVSRSPAGTARHEANELWKTIREEQRHRHEVEWYHLEKHYGDNEQ